jgi:uncharacterized protein (TIGR02246 family)
MRSAKILVASAAIVAIGACAPAAPPEPAMPTDADRQALTDLMARVETAYNAMDTAGMLATITDDYTSISSDGTRTEGKAAYEANMAEEFAGERPEGFSLSIDVGYIQFIGADAASVGGTWSVAGVPEGMPNSGSYLVVAVRSGDMWLTRNTVVAQYTPEPMDEGGN